MQYSYHAIADAFRALAVPLFLLPINTSHAHSHTHFHTHTNACTASVHAEPMPHTQSTVAAANAKLALFFDYLGYNAEDANLIMNIGTCMLAHLRAHTHTLIDRSFLLSDTALFYVCVCFCLCVCVCVCAHAHICTCIHVM